MSEIQDRLKSVADRQKWNARGVGFLTKAKATKAVWFPPKPVEAGKGAASTTAKAGRKATEKTTGTAKKGTGTARKSTGAAANKSTGAARKVAGSTRKVTSPAGRKKA